MIILGFEGIGLRNSVLFLCGIKKKSYLCCADDKIFISCVET
nr:hypothetical protein GPVRGNEL_GPVRGNEL_CDS_0025 [Caudoviricetes sp.]